MKPEFALSGYAEWFYCMARNWKDVENRSWPLPRWVIPELPVRIYLHASKTKSSEDDLNFISTILIKDTARLDEFSAVDWTKYRGAIIGEVTITKQFRKSDSKEPIPGFRPSMGDIQGGFEYLRENEPSYFSLWFFGPFGFVVQDGELYETPMPCRGWPGFFKPALGVV